MKNLLVGNGINIQFDNQSYTTTEIVLRLLKNCDRDDFPSPFNSPKPSACTDDAPGHTREVGWYKANSRFGHRRLWL